MNFRHVQIWFMYMDSEYPGKGARRFKCSKGQLYARRTSQDSQESPESLLWFCSTVRTELQWGSSVTSPPASFSRLTVISPSCRNQAFLWRGLVGSVMNRRWQKIASLTQRPAIQECYNYRSVNFSGHMEIIKFGTFGTLTTSRIKWPVLDALRGCRSYPTVSTET